MTRLPGFEGMNRSEFDAVTLRTNGQRAVLGAVLFAPSPEPNEMAIQFVGHDPYPRESVADWFHTVRAMVMAPPGMSAFYLPTFEQADVARANRDWFEGEGIPIGSAGRWVTGDDCYAPGWTLGRLVFVAGGEIADAYRDGRLDPRDVLLTDAVPSDVPPVAGIVSLSPATPNSHVALLARSFGIPFVHLDGPESEAELRSWVGRDVLVRAIEQFLGCDVGVTVLASPLETEMREDILALKAAPQLDIAPRESAGALHLAVDDLGPSDIRFVGGKAANLGILRRAIPDHSPSPTLAFTFDLWDAYLDRVLPGGKSLRETVTDALGGFEWPPNMADLQETLAGLRELFRNGSDFDADRKQAILGILQDAGFDTHRRIRFRSSTNVEDSEQFTGAGLYDSYSGCLADDLDSDTQGPSHCNPAENNERGVFRALRRVYASFYNDNAFIERLRHGVNEANVGMAVLVHYFLDFEYKKIAPDGRLAVKQIRPIPLPASGTPSTDWLVNTTNRWGLLQGEFANLLSLHRLKSFWTLPIRHTRIAPGHLDATLFTDLDARWIEGTNEVSLSGPIADLPGHRFQRQGNTTEDTWESGTETRRLRVDLGRFAMPDAGPVAILDDLRLEFAVRYATPQVLPTFGLEGQVTTTTVEEEHAALLPVTRVNAESRLQERRMTTGSRVVETSFYWPPHPKGAVAGYTAPLQAWVETTLTGFASRPIVLRGDFAQTYRPGHHNFWEEFLFDPWLEPGTDPDLLAELASENVRGIVAMRDIEGGSWFLLWGLDGTFRQVP